MNVTWLAKHFSELTTVELYDILQLRTDVFVVEQQCIFQDLDNKDQACFHLWAEDEDRKILACTRIVPGGISYAEASIGRVATARNARGTGLGRELMKNSITYLEELYGKVDIKIGAQLYLKEFYSSFGFIQSSDIYDEDGIDHIEMHRASA